MSVRYVQLGDIAEFIVGVPTKPSGFNGPPNVVTVRSLTGHDINPDELDAIEFKGRDVARFQIEPGDVLLSSRSTSVKAGIVRPELAGKIINSTVNAIRLKLELHPRLLVAWIYSDEGREALESSAQSGTAIKSVTAGALKKLSVPVIPLAEQHTLVALLEAADEVYANGIQSANNRLHVANAAVVQKLKGQ